jgi:hypothetical protein
VGRQVCGLEDGEGRLEGSGIAFFEEVVVERGRADFFR